MQVSRPVFLLLNVIVWLLVLVIVAMAFWYLLNMGGATNETKLKGEFVRYEASAMIYYNRLGFYTGVCDDIGVSTKYKCHESENAYAIEANPAPGKFYCLDSTGFSGPTIESKQGSLRCRQN